MDMSQQKHLAYVLRRKGVSESEVSVLLEISREAAIAEGAAFSVTAFADKVPAGRHTSAGTILGRAAAAFVIVALGGQLFLSGVVGIRMGFPGLVYYSIGVLIVLACLIGAGYGVDRRAPRRERR